MINKVLNSIEALRSNYVSIVFLFIASTLLLLSSGLTNKVKIYKDDYFPISIIDLSQINILNIISLLLGLLFFFLSIRFLLALFKTEKIENRFSKLTKTEKRILFSISEEKFNKEIADEFNITISTLKSHINSINKKLKVKSRKDLILIKNKFDSKN